MSKSQHADPLKDGAEVDKGCIECGAKMVIRSRGSDGAKFLGCSNYPTCKHTEPIPQDLVMRLMGQPTLF